MVTATLLLAGFSSAARDVRAQVAGCLAINDDSLRLRAYARGLVATSDADRITLRGSLGFSAMDTTKIVNSIDSRECSKAINGINAYLGTPNRVRQIHLVKVGTSGFMAYEPAWPVDGSSRRPVFVLTKNFVGKDLLQVF